MAACYSNSHKVRKDERRLLCVSKRAGYKCKWCRSENLTGDKVILTKLAGKHKQEHTRRPLLVVTDRT